MDECENKSGLKETKTFLFSYYFDGSWWNIEINAYDFDDAKKRLQSIPNAQYDGELKLTINIPCF
jgi:hypothetical protein